MVCVYTFCHGKQGTKENDVGNCLCCLLYGTFRVGPVKPMYMTSAIGLLYKNGRKRMEGMLKSCEGCAYQDLLWR